MQRRDFVKSVAGGLTILPSGTLFGQNAASRKLNVALIGVWGRGTAHYNALKTQNVVAICDVNENRLKEGVQIFPNAKTYWDWRKLLDQKDVEGVIICTADHHHALIANWALNRGMNVYCEKPLGICIDEVRTVRANYLKQKAKVATQHGTQRHAFPNFERVRELVLDGAIGELQTISGWDARQLPRPGYPAGETAPPSFFHYDQWIGPSPFHPYSPQYFLGTNGMNCLSWNMYRDFGVGQMGDMGAHTMDLLWNAIDAGAPTAIEVDQEVSDKYDPNINPVKLKVTFEHPKNSWRGPVKVVWYQGGLKPNTPRTYVDVTRVGNGAIFEGTKGSIVCDFNSRLIIPNNDDGDMTYYKRRTKEQLLPLIGGTGQVSGGMGGGGRGGAPGGAAAGARGGAPGGAPGGAAAGARGGAVAGARGGAVAGARGGAPSGAQAGRGGATLGGFGGGQMGPDGFPEIKLLEGGIPPAMGLPNPGLQPTQGAAPRVDVFQQEWIDACLGKKSGVTNGTSSKTHCDFDYAGTMMEQMLLGLVAHRAGQRLVYDPATGRVTNMAEANDWLKRTYRDGWTLNG